MQAQKDRTAAGAVGWLTVFRWLLAIALALAVVAHVFAALREPGVADQSASFYAVNMAIELVPAVAYAAAVVLALTRRGGRVIWGVLLACGVALSAMVLFYVGTGEFGELMLAPPCLLALCLVQLLSRSRPSVAEAR